MAERKNPFAKRNGKIITINDLSESEKGLGCNCICPACEGTFIARMGEIRIRHFAHSGEPCDETKQIVNSAYQLAKEAINEKSYIIYPGLYVFCDKSQLPKSYYETLKVESSNKEGYMKLFDVGKMSVKSAEIISDGRGISTALILNDKLAVRLAIDTECCIKKNIVRYENIPTLCIDIGDAIYREKSGKLYWFIADNIENKRWIYSPKVDNWIEPLEKERIKKYGEYLERQRIEKELAHKRQRFKEEQAEKRCEQEYEERLLEIKENATKKQAAYSKPKKEWCCLCKKDYYKEDCIRGGKTGNYYCYECIEMENLDWKEL